MSDTKSVLTECFNAIDTDKSGFIDQQELENVINAFAKHPKCPPEYKAKYNSPAAVKAVCQDFMQAADTSGDKKISLAEFIGFFTAK